MSGERYTVVHPEGFASDGGAGLCVSIFAPDPRPWAQTQQPPGGTIVTCGSCGFLGILRPYGWLEPPTR